MGIGNWIWLAKFKQLTTIVLLLNNFIITHGLYFSEVHWTTAVKLSEYEGYKSISLLSFNIPERTARVFWDLQGAVSPLECPIREVHVFVQQGSYPVINPYNETFPDNFYLQRTGSTHFIVDTKNLSFPHVMENPAPGPWFGAAFLPKQLADKKVKQKGLGTGDSCGYGLSVRLIANVIPNIREISIDQGYTFLFTPKQNVTLLRIMLPDYTSEMTVSLTTCVKQGMANMSDDWECPLVITSAAGRLPDLYTSYNSSHELRVISPGVNVWNYIMVYMPFGHQETVECELVVTVSTCTLFATFLKHPKNAATTPSVMSHSTHVILNVSSSGNDTAYNTPFPFVQSQEPVYVTNFTDNATDSGNISSILSLTHMNSSADMPESQQSSDSSDCIRLHSLGRFSHAVRDFESMFISPNRFNFPLHKNSLYVPDDNVLITDFQLWSELDSGGTLKIELSLTDKKTDLQDSAVWMCLMKNAIPGRDSVKSCPGDAKLYVQSAEQGTNLSDLYIPYPEEGRWYLGLTSQCNKINSSEVEDCNHFPIVEFLVKMEKCVGEACGTYGSCEEYVSGTHIFSACDCYDGWRGYGCTDGTYAYTYTEELVSVLLLTLSNLLFIPGIILALKRRFFIEAAVYFYTMFFSGFYHACDADKVLHFCLMKYSVMSYCDFYGSILSFWVTILAMARISVNLRSFLHMAGALLLAVGVEYDRHGLWVFVAPAGIALAVMVTSWIVQCKKSKSCFPSKRRYLFFLLPGILFAATGLVIFAFLETDDNYKYTHSAWHTVMALCILFLLPSGAKNKVDAHPQDPSCRPSDAIRLLGEVSNGSSTSMESPVRL
ncbi:hypothetical protein ScPMuIL_000071 [Solemya velum]